MLVTIRFFDTTQRAGTSNVWNALTNACEDYFCLDTISPQFGFKKFTVISSDTLQPHDCLSNRPRVLLDVVKIISYFTVVLPLAAIAVKSVYRMHHKFRVCSLPGSVSSRIPKTAPRLLDAVRYVRQLRDDKTFVPPISKDAAWVFIFRKTAPIFSLLEQLPKSQQELIGCGLWGYLDTLCDDALHRRVLQVGSRLSAHGVGNDKTGLKGLLNIMLEGILRSPWWGPLCKGDPSYCAGPHGPYYVIIDYVPDGPSHPDYSPRLRALLVDEKYHIAYLVPHEEHKTFLTTALEGAVDLGMLTNSEADTLISKVVTYQEFVDMDAKDLANTEAFSHAISLRDWATLR